MGVFFRSIFYVLLMFVSVGVVSAGVAEGEVNFKKICMACHTIGKGALVGPDLKDVSSSRDESWLIDFIKSSRTLIKSGDKDAIDIFNKYNKMPMPDHNFSDAEVKDILSYITDKSVIKVVEKIGKKNSSKRKVKKNIEIKVPEKKIATTEEILLGRALFEGRVRLEAKGPSCISCHSVRVPGVISGGSLAVDLTEVFIRMNEAGVKSILKSSPFPVMAKAYENKALMNDEIYAIMAFLHYVNSHYSDHGSNSYGLKLGIVGISGSIGLLVICMLIWNKRKQGTVNQDIYDRQIKSE